MRKNTKWWLPAALAAAVLTLTSCSGPIEEEAIGDDSLEPAQVERVDGTRVSRITLTELAGKRLGIETTQVRDVPPSSGLPTGGAAAESRTSIPYSAVVYDPVGRTWTYTSPEPLVFIRKRIVVDRIEGASALLVSGPATGTSVVTVGAPELWGTEYEVGH